MTNWELLLLYNFRNFSIVCPLSQCLDVILSLLVGRFRYMLLVLVLGDEDSSMTRLGGTSVQVKIHHCLFQHLLWIEYLRVEI